MEKEDRTPTRKTPKRAPSNIGGNDKSNENYNVHACAENQLQLPVTPSNPYKSRKGLMVELDMNAGLGASPLTGTKMKPTPKVIRWQESHSQEEDSADEFEMPARSTFNPKKRWLREAWQDDLAKPLEPTVNAPLNQQQTYQNENNAYECAVNITSKSMPLPAAKTKSPPLNPNQMRPTVLMVASKDKTMPLLNISANIADNNQTQIKNESQPQIATSNYHHRIANSRFGDEMVQPLTNYGHHHHHNQQQQQLSFTELPSTICSTSPDIFAADTLLNDRTDISIISANLDASPPPVGIDSGKNREWHGALALMQLATDEMNSLNSHTTSSSSSSTSSLSTSPSLSINDDTTKASFTVL